MIKLINELNQFIEDDNVIKEAYLFLLTNYDKKLNIHKIEENLNKLNFYLRNIKKNDQISFKKKNKILNILNEIIIIYNEMLMNEICKQL